jgi:hypothetical protein
MQQNSQAGSRVGGWLPNQGGQADPVAPDWALTQDTISLPAFVTGAAAPAPTPAKAPAKNPDKLPPSERNMLIFVALLLLTGTIAIVAMAFG